MPPLKATNQIVNQMTKKTSMCQSQLQRPQRSCVWSTTPTWTARPSSQWLSSTSGSTNTQTKTSRTSLRSASCSWCCSSSWLSSFLSIAATPWRPGGAIWLTPSLRFRLPTSWSMWWSTRCAWTMSGTVSIWWDRWHSTLQPFLTRSRLSWWGSWILGYTLWFSPSISSQRWVRQTSRRSSLDSSATVHWSPSLRSTCARKKCLTSSSMSMTFSLRSPRTIKMWTAMEAQPVGCRTTAKRGKKLSNRESRRPKARSTSSIIACTNLQLGFIPCATTIQASWWFFVSPYTGLYFEINY